MLILYLQLLLVTVLIPILEYEHSNQFDWVLYNLIEYLTIWSSTLQFDRVPYNLIEYFTIWSSTLQFDRVLYNLIEYFTIWSSTLLVLQNILHSTLLLQRVNIIIHLAKSYQHFM